MLQKLQALQSSLKANPASRAAATVALILLLGAAAVPAQDTPPSARDLPLLPVGFLAPAQEIVATNTAGETIFIDTPNFGPEPRPQQQMGGVVSGVPPQNFQPQQFAGSVTGRILCGDTQRPARFAQVSLVPVGAVNGQGSGDMGRMAAGRTDLDGAFVITNVAPGDYYLTATLPGYVSEGALVQAGVNAGADVNQLLSSLPQVHVSNGSTSGSLTLQRGGSLAGNVLWDDGGAAAGVSISAQPVSTSTSPAGTVNGMQAGFSAFNRGGGPAPGAAGSALGMLGAFGQGGNAMTDDQGHFRLTGLAPGQYLVRAVVVSPPPSGASSGPFGSMQSVINVYAPGKVRQTDAATFVVHGAEDRTDLQITLELSGMHTVSGHIGATGGGTVASGTVSLQDQTDGSLRRSGSIGADGNFMIPWVPAGSYALTAQGSSQAAGNGGGGRRNGGSGSGTTFQQYQSTLTVTDGDMSGVNINLSPSSTGSQ